MLVLNTSLIALQSLNRDSLFPVVEEFGLDG